MINEIHLDSNSTLGSFSEIASCGSPLNPSLNYSSAYSFKSIAELSTYYENKYDSVRYGRDSNLLARQVENYFSFFHNGKPALLFNSGMSAISCVIDSLIRKRSRVITFGPFYRKTRSIIENYKNKFDVSHVEIPSIACLRNLDNNLNYENIIYIESPSNPFLSLLDIVLIKEIIPNSIIILDSTLQGLLNSKNNFDKVDVLVSSCTKYIGGHNDLLAGFAIAINEDLYPPLWDVRSQRGGIVDNNTSYMLLRSLRTYDLRLNKTLENIEKVLPFLEGHDQVRKIFYPGRYENKGESNLFENYHYHGGGLVTFEVEESINIKNNIFKLMSTKMAPSFGSIDTLVELPASMSYWGVSKDKLEKLGLTDNTVRLSVGNEPIDFIISDLERLLS